VPQISRYEAGGIMPNAMQLSASMMDSVRITSSAPRSVSALKRPRFGPGR